MAFTIGIVEDHEPQRGFLTELLRRSEGLEVLWAHGTGEAGLNAFRRQPCDLVLVDLNLPGMYGHEFIRAVRGEQSTVLCLVLTIEEGSPFLWKAIEAGANGYLLKPSTPAKIVAAVEDVRDGGAPMAPSIARRVLQKAKAAVEREPDAPAGEGIDLSAAERRVLELLASGQSRKEIAQELDVSLRTIAAHLCSIYSKLHVHSQVKAVLWYAKQARE